MVCIHLQSTWSIPLKSLRTLNPSFELDIEKRQFQLKLCSKAGFQHLACSQVFSAAQHYNIKLYKKRNPSPFIRQFPRTQDYPQYTQSSVQDLFPIASAFSMRASRVTQWKFPCLEWGFVPKSLQARITEVVVKGRRGQKIEKPLIIS